MTSPRKPKRATKHAVAETVEAAKPLIQMLPHQNELFWSDELRRCAAIWRRQGRKSSTLANIALKRMMKFRNHLCVFASASILIGTEFLRKEAQSWKTFVDLYRQLAGQNGKKVTSTIDGLDLDAIADILEHNKLEVKVWHDATSYARSIVVAANPDTAVGWTGDVFLDEVGRVADLKDVLEAVLPFMDNNPQFILRMATTPPPDDTHYSFEYLLPPQEDFAVKPTGNWYRAPSGIMVHRADVFDCAAGGLQLFHPDTGEPVDPETHRSLAFDKTAWDRNYGCLFVRGGIAAVPLLALQRAMEGGKGKGMANDCTEVIAV